MKQKPPLKGMPAHLYITLDGYEFRAVNPQKWLHPLTMQRYVRADLYEKARKRIKALEKELEDINQDLFNRPPIIGGQS